MSAAWRSPSAAHTAGSSTYRNSSWQSEASSFSAFVESESISIPQSGKKLKSQMS